MSRSRLAFDAKLPTCCVGVEGQSDRFDKSIRRWKKKCEKERERESEKVRKKCFARVALEL